MVSLRYDSTGLRPLFSLAHLVPGTRGTLLALLIGFGLCNPTLAEEPADFHTWQQYYHKQCSTTCQVEFDEALGYCLVVREDTEDVAAPTCRGTQDGIYRYCVAQCPTDPGPDPSLLTDSAL